jgi:hypothetical protein
MSNCPRCDQNIPFHGIDERYHFIRDSPDHPADWHLEPCLNHPAYWRERVGLLRGVLFDCKNALESLPEDALGTDCHYGHFYRDELLDKIRQALDLSQLVNGDSNA